MVTYCFAHSARDCEVPGSIPAAFLLLLMSLLTAIAVLHKVKTGLNKHCIGTKDDSFSPPRSSLACCGVHNLIEVLLVKGSNLVQQPLFDLAHWDASVTLFWSDAQHFNHVADQI